MTTQPNVQMLTALLAQSQLGHAEEAILALHRVGELECTQVELKNLVRIYSVRAELAVERGSPVAGWEQLLSGLQQELLVAGPAAKASIFYPDNLSVPIIIFTDESAIKVLGVLVTHAGQIDSKDANEFLNEVGQEGK
jgi:hypothetical protein